MTRRLIGFTGSRFAASRPVFAAEPTTMSVLPREPLRVPMPGRRKRWPAIEPKPSFWLLLMPNGRVSPKLETRDRAALVHWEMRRQGHPAVAIIKVTPK